MALATVYLTPDAEEHLRRYDHEDHAIALPPGVARELTEAGFVERVPGFVMGHAVFSLTEAGAIFQDEQLGGPGHGR